MKLSEISSSGSLNEKLAELQAKIRAHPEDVRLRIYLFQLNCLLGRLDKALVQLQTLASLDAETMLLAQIFRPVIACELLRREVFQGKRTPLIFGEPEEWVGWLLQGSQYCAQGAFAEAAEWRSRAFEAAPGSSGRINGEPFAWLADADSRLGPVLEVILDGKYYWVPFHRISSITFTPPEDLRDLVWLPVSFVWSNGGTASGHIPSRYIGSDTAEDDALRLARKTDWQSHPGDTYLGLGQRVFATDASEYPLLACTTIEFNPPAAS